MFRRNAKRTEIWKYVDPDVVDNAPVLTAPTMVSCEDEIARLNSLAQDRHAEAIQSAQVGSVPPTELPQPPAVIEYLDDTQRQLYKFRREDYESAYEGYLLEKQSYAHLTTWVHETVDPALLRLCPATADLRHVLEKLRRLLCISNDYLVGLARVNYRKSLQTTRRTNPVDWYFEWLFAHSKGVELSIPEVQGYDAISDFLKAVWLWMTSGGRDNI